MALKKRAVKPTIKSSLETLSKRWGLTPMSSSGDGKWHNLSNGLGVGCILSEDENGHVTFVMCCSKLYGHFHYNSLDAAHLDSAAGQLAYDRVFQIAKAIEYIE